ncbi:hypothetical protein [Nitrosovibrio sp. Nv6]|uniref:hypothetical protein n=1 Tax=Nitrosovibrio sp. Nv6 TaxID=1855340 RepID=UPI0008B1D1B1|nr:hypothetical protein [Nitrosovibrio sp. Nv6]SEP42616.1 Conjugal transfer protein TrbH [Nitrosovibrio sp. Nv6]
MRSLFITLLCASLGACALQPTSEGDKRFASYDEKIASDTANQLARLYPPARTQFNFVFSAPTSFGTLLAGKLRAKGYALSESRAVEKGGLAMILQQDTFGASFSPKPATDDKTPAQSPADKTGIELHYAIDHSPAADFSRITVKIGHAMLARAYVGDNGTVAPAGAWTFKE